nr:MAG TPA: hypothetical protein [Bacteriophage sp.]
MVILLCILLKSFQNCENYIKIAKNIKTLTPGPFYVIGGIYYLIYYNFFIVLVYINLRKKDQESTFFLPQKGPKRTNWSLFTKFCPKSAIFQMLTVGPFSIFSLSNSKIKSCQLVLLFT